MTALIELYKTDHKALIDWVCRTYGLVTSSNMAGTLQAPASQSAFTKANAAQINAHRERRESIARRLRLYRDEGLVDVFQLIDQIYTTTKYQTTLKQYVRIALGQNVTRRIVDEVASLYDEPAKRKLKDDKEQELFRAEEKRLHLHELLQEGQRLLTLCNEVLWWQFDGVPGKDGKPQKKLRLITPDMFDIIPDPRDELVEAGVLMDCTPVTILDGDQRRRLPHWELYDDTYRYPISAYGRLVDDAGNDMAEGIAHGLKRIPGALLHRREPTTKILDAAHGSDLVSAHLAVTLLNVMILRLSKVQGENQPVIQGNLAGLSQGQVMDGENPLQLPPETKAMMLNMRTDPQHYLKAKQDVIAGVAQTYGMSYEQFAIGETSKETSGKSYEIRRMKLTEIRVEAKRRALLNEALIVDLMGFDPHGMKVDHREQSLPQDAIEEVALLSDKMRMGLDSPVAYLQRKDTDLHREDAVDLIQKNIEDYSLLIMMLRALNAPMDANGGNVGQSPQQNGAMSKKQAYGGGAQMDNTNFGGPIQGSQVTLRVKSEQASQTIQTGLSDQNPVEGYTQADRPAPTAGQNNR